MTTSSTTSSTSPGGDAPGVLPSTSPRLVIDMPAPGIRAIHVGGVVGTGSAARLLRLIDSQLMLVRSGHLRLTAVVVDLSQVRALEQGGPEAFAHARYGCGRLGIEFALAGTSGALFSTSLDLRGRLREFRMFPTVDAAVDAFVGPSKAPLTPGAVDD